MKGSRHSSRTSSAAAAAVAAASSTAPSETGVVSISRRGSTISSTVAQTPAPTISTIPNSPSTTSTVKTTISTTSTTATSTTASATTTTPNTKTTATNASKAHNQKTNTKDDWTIKEKLYLASLAIKHGNAWNSVARNMQSVFEKERPEGWSNTKSCAAQFDKLMNEVGVDKRPKRNEPSDGNSSSVIYRKIREKRIRELEDSIKNLRELFIDKKNQLDNLEKQQPTETTSTTTTTTTTTTTNTTTTTTTVKDNKDSISDKPTKSAGKAKQNSNITSTTLNTPDKTKPSAGASHQTQQKQHQTQAKQDPDSLETQTTTTTPKSVSTNSKTIGTRQSGATSAPKTESDKPPTRALTRRESSRKNLDQTLENLCKEASEIKAINLLSPPTGAEELALYEKVIKKPMDLSIIKQRLGSDNTDSYAVINDLLLMFQNAIMFYPPNHNIHRTALDLRDKLLPKWEKSLLDTKTRTRH